MELILKTKPSLFIAMVIKELKVCLEKNGSTVISSLITTNLDLASIPEDEPITSCVLQARLNSMNMMSEFPLDSITSDPKKLLTFTPSFTFDLCIIRNFHSLTQYGDNVGAAKNLEFTDITILDGLLAQQVLKRVSTKQALQIAFRDGIITAEGFVNYTYWTVLVSNQ